MPKIDGFGEQRCQSRPFRRRTAKGQQSQRKEDARHRLLLTNINPLNETSPRVHGSGTSEFNDILFPLAPILGASH